MYDVQHKRKVTQALGPVAAPCDSPLLKASPLLCFVVMALKYLIILKYLVNMEQHEQEADLQQMHNERRQL